MTHKHKESERAFQTSGSLTVDRSTGATLTTGLLHLALGLLAFLALFPFYWMIAIATQANNDVYTTINLFPSRFLRENLDILLEQGLFRRAYVNSIVVTGVGTSLSVMVSALTGYTFAMFRFRGKEVLFAVVLSTMMIPIYVGIIGYVVQMRIFGLIDTLMPLILTTVAHAYGVFWMNQYIRSSLPYEMLESGRADGCSEIGIFFRIVIPVIQPAIFSLAILVFVLYWNNLLYPLVLINDQDLYTIPLAIINLRGLYRTQYAAQFLAAALASLPLLIVFLTSSQRVISGLTAGAVKE